MRLAITLLVALASAAVSCPASAISMVLDANHDASIFENNPDSASGAGNGLFAGTNGSKSPRRALISFDLSALPLGAAIQAVELKLFLGQIAGSGGGGNEGTATSTIDVRRIAAPWGEGTSQRQTPRSDTLAQMGQGDDAEEGDVTWTASFFSMSTPTLWGTPGGVFASTASTTLTVGTTINVPYTWPSTPAMVSDVQAWLSNPAANNGWMLVNQDELTGTNFRAFYSRDVATESYHPKLTITYTAPVLTADFNGDNNVDGVDFLTWQRGLGILSDATPQMGDATGDGAVTALDLAKWRDQFGMCTPPLGAVPEPTVEALSLWAVLTLWVAGHNAIFVRRRRRRRRVSPIEIRRGDNGKSGRLPRLPKA